MIVVLCIGLGVFWMSGGMSSCFAPDPIPMSLNAPVQGEVSTFTTYQIYELELFEPTVVSIAVTSGFDSYLEVYQGDSSTPLVQDDDSGSGLDAMIQTTLAAGVFYILVRPYDDDTGQFKLTALGKPGGGRGHSQ